MPGGGMTVLLAQSAGLRRAIEVSLTGNFLTAADALGAGLINHVVPHDELIPAARKIAADIVSNDQRAVRRLLLHYRKLANAATLDEAHLLEGYLAETWQPGTSHVAARREEVTARGRCRQTSNDQRLVPGRVLLAQPALVQLAVRLARQLTGEVHAARALVAGQLAAAVREQFGRQPRDNC
jgi:enoyl-CoA hydratase/carnithine racemase